MSTRPAQPRRRLFGVLAVAGLLAISTACGDDDDSGGQSSDSTAADTTTGTGGGTGATTTAAADEPDDVDPNGVLRIVANIAPTTANGNLDLEKLPSPAMPLHTLIYGTLLRARPDGTVEPGLAKSAEVVDPRTIRVELQPNVTYSDGTPFDAEAVKAGIERNVASQNFRAFGAEIAQYDSITIEDPLNFTIHLKEPMAGVWYSFLARGETMAPSPKAIADGVDFQSNPVGAGPFMVESVSPERSIRLVKNPNYFEADKIRLAGVEYVHAADPTGQVNALRSGAADAMDAASSTVADGLEGAPGFQVMIEPANNITYWGQICKARPPLDDKRVRQAINFALDRDALNQLLYEGRGEPIEGLARSTDPLYDPTTKGMYARDLDKARQLLADAGYADGLTLDFFVQPGDSQRGSEVIQQQLAEVGITLDLAQSQNLLNEFFNTRPDAVRIGIFFGLERGGLDRITRTFIPGGSGNICQTVHQPLIDMVEEMQGLQADSPEFKAVWAEASQYVMEEALALFGVFGVWRNVVSEDIGNPTFIASFQGTPFLDIQNAYMKA